MDETFWARVRELQRIVEQSWFQAYCQVEFAGSTWTWGRVTWRYAMSGALDGQLDFDNPDRLMAILTDVASGKHAPSHLPRLVPMPVSAEDGAPPVRYERRWADGGKWFPCPMSEVFRLIELYHPYVGAEVIEALDRGREVPCGPLMTLRRVDPLLAGV